MLFVNMVLWTRTDILFSCLIQLFAYQIGDIDLTQMPIFSDSTQRRHWMFTRSELAQKRLDARLQYDKERALHNEEEPVDGYLSRTEQDLLLYYYQRRISDFAAAFSLPISVQGTAMVYFKRFYLNRTVMDEDPRLISISSLLLATKSEEAHIRVGDLARSTQVSIEILLEFEQILLEGIDFHLKVHIPFRAMHGFINELPNLTKSETRAVLVQAETQAMHAIYTDAIFLYTPSQIALVCVQRSAKVLRLKSFSEWFTRTFSSHADYVKLLEVMKDIDEMIENILSRSIPNDTEIWARLKHKRDQCKNCIRDPTSIIFYESVRYQQILLHETQERSTDLNMNYRAKQHKEKMEQEREDRRLKKHLDASSRSNSFLDSLTTNSDVIKDRGEKEDEFILKKNLTKRRRTENNISSD